MQIHCTQMFTAHTIKFLRIRYGVHCCVEKGYEDELIFVDPRRKGNGQYYHDVLLSQQMLSVVKHVAGYTFVNETTLHLIVPTTQTATARNAALHWS